MLYERIAAYLPSQSVRQKIYIIGSIVVDSYSVLVGCYFSIFVPQLCYGRDGVAGPAHPCNVMENLMNPDPHHQGALALNTIVAAMFLATFAYEAYRENWIKNHFIVDTAVAGDQLKTEIEAYPALKAKMERINTHHALIIYFTWQMSMFNTVLCMYLLHNSDNGFQTYTTYITNTIVTHSCIYRSVQTILMHKGEYFVKSIFPMPTQYTRVKVLDAAAGPAGGTGGVAA
jgi:hypothetical protein